MIEYVIVGNVVAYAPVAQLDRVSDYESEGREFESLPARQVEREYSSKRSRSCCIRLLNHFDWVLSYLYPIQQRHVNGVTRTILLMFPNMRVSCRCSY